MNENEMKIEQIKRINKSIVHEDGAIDSFDKQLIQLVSGVYDTRYPMIMSDDSSSLQYINDIEIDYPLVINVSTVIKIREKHDIGYEFVSECVNYFKESVLAMQSTVHESSKIIVFDEFDDEKNPIVAVCRTDKVVGRKNHVNEVTSVYDKERLAMMIVKTYEQNKVIYTNKKTEQYIKSIGFYFPKELIFALSINYDRTSFTKSQVEQDIKSNNIDIDSILTKKKETMWKNKYPDEERNKMIAQEIISTYEQWHIVEHEGLIYDVILEDELNEPVTYETLFNYYNEDELETRAKTSYAEFLNYWETDVIHDMNFCGVLNEQGDYSFYLSREDISYMGLDEIYEIIQAETKEQLAMEEEQDEIEMC